MKIIQNTVRANQIGKKKKWYPSQKNLKQPKKPKQKQKNKTETKTKEQEKYEYPKKAGTSW